ncbi:MAG TPA: TlpA disulfide reductase family protein [Pyrinomonadaceae bacterium]|jgi:thiol-disulfide isomerase/thioredoxin
MKVVLKNIALFIVLTLAFSALTACTGSQTASVNDKSTAPANSAANGGAPDKPKVNYPPAPAAIMQADVKNLDNTTFKLQDKKGKVVLVNLWATWCGPCIAEMPHLNEMQEKYRDKGFEIIGLDTDDESKEDIEAFAAKQKLNYQLGWADSELMGEFVKVTRLAGIPQSILINREGQLTGVFTGGGPKVINQMKETVEKVVNE